MLRKGTPPSCCNTKLILSQLVPPFKTYVKNKNRFHLLIIITPKEDKNVAYVKSMALYRSIFKFIFFKLLCQHHFAESLY